MTVFILLELHMSVLGDCDLISRSQRWKVILKKKSLNFDLIVFKIFLFCSFQSPFLEQSLAMLLATLAGLKGR